MQNYPRFLKTDVLELCLRPPKAVVLKLFFLFRTMVLLQISPCLVVHYQTEGKQYQKWIFKQRLFACNKYSSIGWLCLLPRMNSSFNPLLGRTWSQSRGLSIWLSRHPEPSDHALCESSIIWTVEDHMTNGLFICATLTSHRRGHTSCVRSSGNVWHWCKGG